MHNLATGETTNSRLAGGFFPVTVSENWLLIGVVESDTKDEVWHLVDLSRLDELRSRFTRGDANADGKVDVADLVDSIDELFPGFVLPRRGGEQHCSDAADMNDDGVRDVLDALHLASFLFSGGPPPPAPFPGCGPDATDDDLTCLAFETCQ